MESHRIWGFDHGRRILDFLNLKPAPPIRPECLCCHLATVTRTKTAEGHLPRSANRDAACPIDRPRGRRGQRAKVEGQTSRTFY